MSYGDLQPQARAGQDASREVRFAFANSLPTILSQLGITILVSTYQAGKLVVIGPDAGKLHLSFHNLDRPMGIVVDQSLDRMAVATRNAVWIARNETTVARQMVPPAGSCFLTRSAHVTGDVQAHQLGWAKDELWIVNTRFSCLCTLDERNSFIPRWQPKFIDQLAAEDRCHLNGMAMWNGRPRYVTAMAQTNVAEGWRADKHEKGCLIDVDSQEVIAEGFAMPHSPEVYGGDVLLLDSGHGTLVCVDKEGEVTLVGRFPGYTRGLAVYQNLAIVGLSKIRETSTFGNLPISEKQQELRCGFAIVDLSNGSLVSQFEFNEGVDEIFDIAIIAHPGHTVFRGPHAEADGQDTIWVVPTPSSRHHV